MGIVKEVGGAHLSQSVGVAVGNEGQWEKSRFLATETAGHTARPAVARNDMALLGGNGIKDHWRGA